MESIFDKACFTAEAGVPALDWSGMRVAVKWNSDPLPGWLRAPLSMFCIVLSGLLSQGFISQCL